MVIFRRKKGGKKPFPITPKKGISFPTPSEPPKRNYSSFDDEYNRRRQREFFQNRIQEFEEREQQTKEQKKQDRIDKFFSLNLELGHAKGFLIKATPVLVQLDPTLSAIYTGWKVGKYGYCFLKQVNEEYKRTGNLEESLKTVTIQQVENKIVSKIKAIPTKQSFQYAANRICTLCKERYSDGKIDPKWDNFAENALVKSFEEAGGRLL